MSSVAAQQRQQHQHQWHPSPLLLVFVHPRCAWSGTRSHRAAIASIVYYKIDTFRRLEHPPALLLERHSLSSGSSSAAAGTRESVV